MKVAALRLCKKERKKTVMKKKWYLILILLLLCVLGIYYYAVFPAVNIHLQSFWIALFFILVLFGMIFAARNIVRQLNQKNRMTPSKLKQFPLVSKVLLGVAAVVAVILILGSLAGSTFFRAKSYASLQKVHTYQFSEDMVESDRVTDIALMDTESARRFGNRKIGSLSEVVSQYEVEADYTQISIDKKPMKVSALKYASFFKWLNNRDKGVPGYVRVDPVTSNAEYVALKKGMKYVPSAYFNYNLQRHVQFKYPAKIISGYHFETDDEGNPFYVCPTLTARIGLFSGMDVNGVIICDPVTGDCRYYTNKEIPLWIDSVYDGTLLTRKYDWYGTLSGGFWNSIIGQKGCKQTTDDYGYKIIEDDVWIYTGVTSVTGDQSNIGFVLMNQRTSEAKYYKVSGAEEHSAMESAEGAVQEKGYLASFPSLINVSGEPTYIMVLKDDAGLVKMYAMVNVEQYNIVATASSQSEVFQKYKRMLSEDGKTDVKQERMTTDIQVQDIQFIETEDGTIVYLKDTNRAVYKQAFEENEELIKIMRGDQLHIAYEPSENGIHALISFELLL